MHHLRLGVAHLPRFSFVPVRCKVGLFGHARLVGPNKQSIQVADSPYCGRLLSQRHDQRPIRNTNGSFLSFCVFGGTEETPVRCESDADVPLLKKVLRGCGAFANSELHEPAASRNSTRLVHWLPQTQAALHNLQPLAVSQTRVLHAVDLVAGMEDDKTDLVLSAIPGVLLDLHPAEDLLQHDAKITTGALETAEKKCFSENENVQKEKKKRKRPKIKGRKQKAKASDCSNTLLAELPFANTEISKEFGITSSEKGLKKKRKRKIARESEEDADEKKKQRKDQRPNYFVSVPITNPKIKGGIEAVQDIIVQKDHRLSKAMIPVGSLHITLLVTHLSTEEEVNAAVCALTELKDVLRDLLQGKELVLPFAGIGHFRSEVAFVQLAEGDHVTTLRDLAEAVRKAFEGKGILAGDSRAFKPHLTFMKLSRSPKLRHQGVKKLDAKLYEHFERHRFGEESLSRLDLCSMLKKKTTDGYYHCEASVTLGIKRDVSFIRKALQRERGSLLKKLVWIKDLLCHPATLARIRCEMAETGVPSAGALACR
ncbi:A-kinase anchor protein 7 isoform X2 [Lepisosteus oculatus]|uniref:A-kinase anchor protein 7 isoform X2 n=1 Tax=Lepisosteus oculatus TaxID=7918 RepID=UPI00074006F9|nr:PREDICTED: A-kinase anchor protein 7 isoform gamma isoform X2 [Lepisosteus oculatus]